MRPERVTYGEHRSQFCERSLPAGEGPCPVVVMLHGGWWRAQYGLQLSRPLAADLAERGWGVWNVEYRRVGDGGGWPATVADVAAAIDSLAEDAHPRFDLDRVVAVGQSAGGHLAFWAAGRPGLPADAPGARPRVALRGAVSQAGAVDLVELARLRVGEDAVQGFMGGEPAELADAYALASPAERLALGVPTLLVHGEADDAVPPAVSASFTERARTAGDDCELALIPGEDHGDLSDPRTQGWRAVLDWLGRFGP